MSLSTAMEFTTDREKFLKILSIISHQVLIRPALPILANILIQAEKNNLAISATNLELGIILNLEAKTAKAGTTTLPAKTLTELISGLEEKEVKFKLENSEMEVAAGRFLAKLPTIPADEYPQIPKIAQVVCQVPGDELAAIFERVVFAAAVDSARPILTGVLFEFSGKNLRLVATDGYRLSAENLVLGKNLEERTLVVPAKTLQQLVRVILQEKSAVKILQDPTTNQIGFEVTGTLLVSRLTEGTFPDWQKIVPSEFKTKAVISKAELLQAVKTTSVFAKEAGNVVKLSFEKGLEITTQSSAGTSKTTVAAKILGTSLEIAFNWRFLTDALQATPGNLVEIELVESLAPAKFTPAEKDSDFFHIIMPVRI